jgi:hypothetical protein
MEIVRKIEESTGVRIWTTDLLNLSSLDYGVLPTDI